MKYKLKILCVPKYLGCFVDRIIDTTQLSFFFISERTFPRSRLPLIRSNVNKTHIILYSLVLFRYVERDAAQSFVAVLDVSEKSHSHVHNRNGGHADVQHTGGATE